MTTPSFYRTVMETSHERDPLAESRSSRDRV
jgi:hypothetical protein